MPSAPFLRYLIAGQLRRDYILTPTGEAHLDIPGGGIFYAAAGLAIWESEAGLIARIGEDYPQEWLDQLSEHGFDLRGIERLPELIDLRSFYAYQDFETCRTDSPISHFAHLDIPFPKSLLGYSNQNNLNAYLQYPSLGSSTPEDYLDATAAHLCPLDLQNHTLLPDKLRKGQITTITLDPSAEYMNPLYWDQIINLLQSIDAFLVSEQKVFNLFKGHDIDIWEAAENLTSFGCDVIVIKCQGRGQYLYDHASGQRWIIPAYPAKVVDPTGAGDAFCGGFLAGYRKSYDPLEATLYGNISASHVVEGSGPFYPLNALPGLARARLEHLRGKVRKI